MTKEKNLISRNWFGIRTNIRRRIVITFGFLTVISLLILSALQGVNSYITFQQKNYQYQSVLTESAALQVQYYINGIRQSLETLSVLGDGDLYLISQSSQLLFTQTPPLLEVIAVDLQGTVIGGAAARGSNFTQLIHSQTIRMVHTIHQWRDLPEYHANI